MVTRLDIARSRGQVREAGRIRPTDDDIQNLSGRFPESDVAETITGQWVFDENIEWKSGTSFKGILDHANGADRTYTFPDEAGTISLLERAETFAGVKTHNGDLRGKSGGANLGIHTHSNSADRTYTYPDESGTVSLIGRDETLSGDKTFSGAFILSSTDKTLSADQNDWDAGSTPVTRIECTGVLRTVTGITGGVAGQVRVFRVHGSNNLTLANQNAGSAAANRIITGAGLDITLMPDESAILWYDGTTQRWVVVAVR